MLKNGRQRGGRGTIGDKQEKTQRKTNSGSGREGKENEGRTRETKSDAEVDKRRTGK